MAQVTIAIQETNSNYSSTWSHVFQGGNVFWLGLGGATNRMTLGNFFLGLQGQVQNAFNAQIPPGAVIVSATYEYTPFNLNLNATFVATINSPDRQQVTQPQDAIQSPFQVFRGYRNDQWSNAQVGALSTTFTAVFGTSVTTNASWIMRQITAPGAAIANRDHMAQRITTRTGNMTIASLFWELRRTGNPTGNLTVRIQGVTNDRGVDIPNGIDVLNGVSNPKAASSIATVATLETFSFPINPTLVAGTDYFILIEPEYPANNVDYISVHHQNTFLIAGGGELKHYGEGLGMDWQNFPGVVDLNQAFNITTIAGQDVSWDIGTQNPAFQEVTPDISALVQAQIDAPNYTIDSGIIIALSRVLPTAQARLLDANVNFGNGAILRIVYEEPIPPPPDRRGGDPKGAWGDTFARFTKFKRNRQEKQALDIAAEVAARVPRETISTVDELDDLSTIIANLEVEIEALRESELTSLDIDTMRQDLQKEADDASFRRGYQIFLEARRRQIREDELAFMAEVARQVRARLKQQLAVATATVAILFPTEL